MRSNDIEMKIYRVHSLPEVGEPGAMYIYRYIESGNIEIYVADKDTGELRGTVGEFQVSNMINNGKSATTDKLYYGRTIKATGDAAWEVVFDGSENVENVLTLTDTGAAPGTYGHFTVDSKGRVTAIRAQTADDLPNIPGSKITSAVAAADHAGTADKLKAIVNINGVAFDGSADIVISAVDTATPRVATTEKGAMNGVCPLDANGMIDPRFLPGTINPIKVYDDYNKLPGNPGAQDTNELPTEATIYIVSNATSGDNTIYRWTGTDYLAIPTGVGLADRAVALETGRYIKATGDATWEVLFDGSSNVTSSLTLADTGVVAGTYGNIVVDSKGRVTSIRALELADLPDNIDHTKVKSAASIYVAGAEF